MFGFGLFQLILCFMIFAVPVCLLEWFLTKTRPGVKLVDKILNKIYK